MKMFLRGMSLAAMVACPATFTAAQQSYADSSYYSQTASDDEIVDNEVAQVSATAYVGDEDTMPAMTAPTQAQTASVRGQGANYQAAGFRRSVGSSSSSGSSSRGSYSKLMAGNCPEVWASAEALLWFPQARTGPALVSFNDPGTSAVLGTPGVTTYGEELGNELTAGGRFDAGRYFGDGTFGIGGRFWIIGEDSSSADFAGNGAAGTIARPYFDTNLGNEFAVQIGSTVPTAGAPSGFTGSVSVDESLSMLGAEAYGRLNFGRGREFHTDLIGGYSYFSIDNNLAIDSTTTLTAPSTGAVTVFRDRFNVENEFQGGQIGAETVLRRGRWVARSLTKVHLGNMNQLVNVSGDSDRNAAGGAPLVDFGDGLLAGGRNGTFERDVFTFAPEVNLKLGYRFRDHVTFNVGYSFIYWNNVALVGDQIDRNLEFDVASVLVRRGLPYSIKDRGFWVQGIDLGATIEF